MKEVIIINNLLNLLSILDKFINPLSLIFSFCTFCLSLRINKRVSDKIDRVEFRKNVDTYIGDLLTFIDILELDDELGDFSKRVTFFVSQFSNKHSSLPFKIRRLLKKINRIDYSKAVGPNKDEKCYKEAVENFFALKNLFEKENMK